MKQIHSGFLAPSPWDTLTALAKKARRRKVAVGYLNSGAYRLLPLRTGDTLVVDMSLKAVRQGQTNPSEVAKFVKRDVDVFTCANLHAKVYLFDNCVAIGSANASNNSTRLIECVTVSRDPRTVTQARRFVASIARERVTPGYLRLCKREYRPPKHDGKRPTRKSRADPEYSRLWLIGTQPTDLSQAEERLDIEQRKRAQTRLRNRRQYEVDTIRWDGHNAFTRSVAPGDQVIQFYDSGRSIRAFPPSRVLHRKNYKSFDSIKAPRVFVYVEQDRRPKTVSAHLLRTAIRQAGVEISTNPCRELKSPKTVGVALSFWT